MDVIAEIESLGPWYHTIDLGGGVSTPGRSPVGAKFEMIADHLPPSLAGLRVLDLGCNAGGLAVEFAKRGARVVGVEAGFGYYRQACWVRDRLGLDIEYHNVSIYEIGRLDGTFDVVLFLGLLYHLRYPQLSLDLLATKCLGTLLINTPVVHTTARIMELRVPESPPRVDQVGEPRYNWWFPSPSALRDMLSVAGFSDIVEITTSAKPFVSSSNHVDNSSAFPTGSVYLRATGDGSGSLPAAVVRGNRPDGG